MQMYWEAEGFSSERAFREHEAWRRVRPLPKSGSLSYAETTAWFDEDCTLRVAWDAKRRVSR